MPLAANQQLYEYRIACVLGQGGFGTVYLAHDTLLDRLVAIKGLVVTRPGLSHKNVASRQIGF